MQRIVATVFTAGAVVVLIVCWLLGWVIILTATSGEYRSIHENDRPASYHLLTFSPWKTGAGDCLPSQIHGLLQDLAITRHRVGQAQGVITQMIYCEAEYKMADGSLRITHATGPHSMISHRYDTFVFAAGCTIIIAAGLFLTSPSKVAASRSPDGQTEFDHRNKKLNQT